MDERDGNWEAGVCEGECLGKRVWGKRGQVLSETRLISTLAGAPSKAWDFLGQPLALAHARGPILIQPVDPAP
jgi:hypothetical protein